MALNYLKTQGYTDFSMTGLSGGGWTTTLYAAITEVKGIGPALAEDLVVELIWWVDRGEREEVLVPGIHGVGAGGTQTRQELREEAKESDGSPEMKGRSVSSTSEVISLALSASVRATRMVGTPRKKSAYATASAS